MLNYLSLMRVFLDQGKENILTSGYCKKEYFSIYFSIFSILVHVDF